MEDNRRETYRHGFPLPERLPVTLQLWPDHEHLFGEVVDLSLGGMCVCLSRPVALHAGQDVIAWFPPTILLWAGDLVCTVIHVHEEPEGLHVGLSFHPLDDPAANESRQKDLWRFLLREQRKRRAVAGAGPNSR